MVNPYRKTMPALDMDKQEMYSNAFFFFQAEDGIRDLTVTGVQTCALPILAGSFSTSPSSDRNSLHSQGDPAVRRVVLAFHKPVVTGIGHADHDVFDGVADQLVVRIDQRGERGP